jgi:DNA (cytosine-5)-methyltransferase 1
MLRVLEAFSGIGTQSMALKRLGINYEVVAISEIDEDAIKTYEAIHGKANNLGDISKVTIEDVPDHDLLTYSFPCQDVSLSGKLKGIEEDSETNSSMLWEAMRIAEHKKPKYLVAENVKNLISKRFKEDFNKWLTKLDELGYNTYYGVLNSFNFNIPQNRERVFVISIRKDIDDGKFEMPKPIGSNKRLVDILEDNVDEWYYMDKYFDYFIYDDGEPIVHTPEPRIKIVNATKQGYLLGGHGDGIDFAYPKSKTRRGRVQPQRSHTLSTQGNMLGIIVYEDKFRIRRMTPLEWWRLMGISDEDYQKARTTDVTDFAIQGQAGNAIVVDVLYNIFKNLLTNVKDNDII